MGTYLQNLRFSTKFVFFSLPGNFVWSLTFSTPYNFWNDRISVLYLGDNNVHYLKKNHIIIFYI
jgi:hypothetical protein